MIDFIRRFESSLNFNIFQKPYLQLKKRRKKQIVRKFVGLTKRGKEKGREERRIWKEEESEVYRGRKGGLQGKRETVRGGGIEDAETKRNSVIRFSAPCYKKIYLAPL